MRFFAMIGIDARLFYLVPLSTLLTVLLLSVWTGVAGGLGVREGLAMGWNVLLPGAILIVPFTLPPALAGWVLARVLCWLAGFGTHVSAILSGGVAGLASLLVPMLAGTDGSKIASGLVVAIFPAVAGMLAAAILYWNGWRRMAADARAG